MKIKNIKLGFRRIGLWYILPPSTLLSKPSLLKEEEVEINRKNGNFFYYQLLSDWFAHPRCFFLFVYLHRVRTVWKIVSVYPSLQMRPGFCCFEDLHGVNCFHSGSTFLSFLLQSNTNVIASLLLVIWCILVLW